MADRYTKIVLTFIAVALGAIALEHATPEARAQNTGGGPGASPGCGLTAATACWVHVLGFKGDGL